MKTICDDCGMPTIIVGKLWKYEKHIKSSKTIWLCKNCRRKRGYVIHKYYKKGG